MPPPVFVWFALASIWGSTWLFIKIGLDAGLPPITFAGIRFLIASAPLALWAAARGIRLPRSGAEWRLMIVTGLLTFTVNYSLVFWGESHISSGLAAILYTTFPMFGMVMAHAMLPDEPLRATKVAGVLLAAGGVTLIFYNQIELRGTLAFLGSVAIVVASGGTAFAGVLVKRDGAHIEPATMTLVQMVAGFIPMLAIGIPLEGNPLHYAWTPRAAIALCYLAFVGSTLSFVLLYWLMQRMPVTRTMLIPFWSTLIAVALGSLVLGEQLSWRAFVGGGGILVGLLAATRTARPLSSRIA